jgi:NDP-sugar pyrophosphorylase family protein
MNQLLHGGIMAAGHGNRFRKAGFTVPKPLIEVNSTPLLGHAVSLFRKAGICNISIVFNSENINKCREYLLSSFPDVDFDIICRDTATSAETFLVLASSIAEGRMVVTTVDSIYLDDTFRKFVENVSNLSSVDIALGMTGYIDDEKPLYISVDSDGHVVSLGAGQSDFVTCGVYSLDAKIVSDYDHLEFPALRKLLARFVQDGYRVSGFDMGQVVDVDRPEDIKKAESFIEHDIQFR